MREHEQEPDFKYIYLYLTLLYIEKTITSDEPDDSETFGETFDKLTTKEKLYLLELLSNNKGLLSLSGSKLLETSLSLITGIKQSTLKGNLKEYTTWFSAKKKTSDVLFDREKSLRKIKDELKNVGNSEILKEMIEKLDLDISLIEYELGVRKKNSEKKG
jgi:hypothetical protein